MSLSIRLIGFAPGVDIKPIERNINNAENPILAAEQACDRWNAFYNYPHPAHNCAHHQIAYRITTS